MDVTGKYLKDESGNIFSPITNVSTIYDNNSQSLPTILNGCIKDVCLASSNTQHTVSINALLGKRFSDLVIKDVSGYVLRGVVDFHVSGCADLIGHIEDYDLIDKTYDVWVENVSSTKNWNNLSVYFAAYCIYIKY